MIMEASMLQDRLTMIISHSSMIPLVTNFGISLTMSGLIEAMVLMLTAVGMSMLRVLPAIILSRSSMTQMVMRYGILPSILVAQIEDGMWPLTQLAVFM